MMALLTRKDNCRSAGEGRIRRAWRSERGFTLTEALATVIIVGLVTSILASGIALATRQYTKSMATSEAQMLFSSLERVLDTELRYTSQIYTENGYVVGFNSKHYFVKDNKPTLYLALVDEKGVVQTGETFGCLAFASKRSEGALTNPILGSGSYNYGLGVSVPAITYDNATRYFTVTISISNDGGQTTLVSESFSVKALNAVAETSATN